MRTFHHLPIYINKVYYFLDGCAGQYKTCKNMLNQTYHFKDFGIKETRQLFATSRGKFPWHKIAGATKIFTVKKVFNVSIEIKYLLFKKSGQRPWNYFNLYTYSSGSAANRNNERKIQSDHNNPRNIDCHENNLKGCWFCTYLFIYIYIYIMHYKLMYTKQTIMPVNMNINWKSSRYYWIWNRSIILNTKCLSATLATVIERV